MNRNSTEFGQTLARLLDAKGVFADQLATRIGITKKRLADVLSDGAPPRLEWLQPIAERLELSDAAAGELALVLLKSNRQEFLVRAISALVAWTRLHPMQGPLDALYESAAERGRELAETFERMAESARIGP